MRHLKGFNHLSRTSAHRGAMLSNMASSLILHKKINTTLAKAKALRSYVEPLITRSKEDTTHNRRIVFSYLQNKEAVTELFREISKKVTDRPGGYTRIFKTVNRQGDNAEMCLIELVDYNEIYVSETKETKEKPSRRRRSGGKKKEEEIKGEVASPKAKSAASPAPEKETVTEEPEATAETDVAEAPLEEAGDNADEPAEGEEPKA